MIEATKKSSRKKRAFLNTQRDPPGRGLADLIIYWGAMNLSSSSSLRPALLRDSDDEAFFRCPCAMMYVVWR